MRTRTGEDSASHKTWLRPFPRDIHCFLNGREVGGHLNPAVYSSTPLPPMTRAEEGRLRCIDMRAASTLFDEQSDRLLRRSTCLPL